VVNELFGRGSAEFTKLSNVNNPKNKSPVLFIRLCSDKNCFLFILEGAMKIDFN